MTKLLFITAIIGKHSVSSIGTEVLNPKKCLKIAAIPESMAGFGPQETTYIDP